MSLRNIVHGITSAAWRRSREWLHPFVVGFAVPLSPMYPSANRGLLNVRADDATATRIAQNYTHMYVYTSMQTEYYANAPVHVYAYPCIQFLFTSRTPGPARPRP